MPLVDINAALAASAVTWADLRWIRDLWPGPIIVKGVLTGDDARCAIDEGVTAISVSNHGGRQLDGVPAALRALPEIVAAVNGQVDVLMDGGIRRGTDIVKAICLGARAVLCGRAYAYGLAAAGEAGVARAIEILRTDLERTLRLLGCASIAALDHSYVNIPQRWLSQPGRDLSSPNQASGNQDIRERDRGPARAEGGVSEYTHVGMVSAGATRAANRSAVNGVLRYSQTPPR
jgi:L-lactate dehydrogenase (cytochrome)